MSKIDLTFQELCKNIKNNGRKYANKNRNVERLQITSNTFKHDMRDGFPAITNKKLPFKFVKGELIWFLRGDTDVKYLNDNRIPIWNKDAYNWYKKTFDMTNESSENVFSNGDGLLRMLTFEEFVTIGKGSVGQNYSAQWRNYNGNTDQIAELIQGMREDIMSSRLKVEAWNPSEINKTALPPCHTGFQIIGVPLTDFERKLFLNQKEGWQDQFQMIDEDPNGDIMEICDVENIPKFGFELHWNQRSVDTFLG
jgi:thymidylate synthase